MADYEISLGVPHANLIDGPAQKKHPNREEEEKKRKKKQKKKVSVAEDKVVLSGENLLTKNKNLPEEKSLEEKGEHIDIRV